MPTGHKGQKRSTDVVSNAAHVMKELTGESEDAPAFKAVARRQSKVVAASAKARADQRFIDAISDGA